MASFRFGGSDRHYDDSFSDRKRFGGFGSGGDRDRYGGHGGRSNGPSRGRRDFRQGDGKKTRRGVRGGRDRSKDDKGKRKHSSDSLDDNPSKKYKAGNNWHGPDRHSLMQALPMESRPDNFKDDWVCIVCPPGRKRMVVAANNITQTYNNGLNPDMKFESCLPSGNETKDAMFKQKDLCVLDTMYNQDKKIFYVIDMVHWRHYPYYDTEAEFRFFCLEDKWAQLKTPNVQGPLNDFSLELLPKHPCSDEAIKNALTNYNDKIDKLLFIKKNSLYTPNESFCCLKLKLDKLKDILEIDVPDGVDFDPSTVVNQPKQGGDIQINNETVTSKQKEDSTEAKSQGSSGSSEKEDNRGEGTELVKNEVQEHKDMESESPDISNASINVEEYDQSLYF